MNPAQTPIQASTQQHLNIEDVQDDLIFLKDGSCCLILKTTAINFGLLSEREQEATIFAYAGLLNSLTFPIQILIHSRQKDISSYLTLIDQHLTNQKSEKLREQIQKYRQFIETTVKKNKVLDKKFYLVIPFISVQFKKSKRSLLLEKAKTDLFPKRDHLINQFQRLGLKARQLNSQEIIKLLYSIYNPEVEGQKFVASQEYASSLVQAKKPPGHSRAASAPVQQTQVQPQSQPTQTVKPTVKPIQPISQPKPQVTPPPQPTPPSLSRKVESAQTGPVKPTALNLMKPKKQAEVKVLEGQKLQNKINNIVQQVAGQPVKQNP